MIPLLANALVLASLALTTAQDASGDVAPVTPDNVRSALGDQKFPWYDAGADRVKPVLPSPDFEAGRWKTWGDRIGSWFAPIGRLFRWLNLSRIPYIGGLGDVVLVGLALLALTLLLVILMELLRRYRPPDDERNRGAAVIQQGRAQRIEGLPAGVRVDHLDPLAEAKRLRAAGDLGGAIIYLFAHQLLSLEQKGLLRLVPGRTGRQLVRSVGDRRLTSAVEPTLRLFEAVYYGHRPPTPEAFESAWALAEAFERSLSPVGGAA